MLNWIGSLKSKFMSCKKCFTYALVALIAVLTLFYQNCANPTFTAQRNSSVADANPAGNPAPAPEPGPDGNLYVATDSGSIWRIVPQ